MRTVTLFMCLTVMACDSPIAELADAGEDLGPTAPIDVDAGILSFGRLVDRSDVLPPRSQSTTDVRMLDVNGDGKLDLVWSSQDWPATGTVQIAGGLELTLNDGHGHFHDGNSSGLAALGSWQFLLPFDADGDGDQDLVVSRAARMEAEVALLLNDGNGHFTASATFPKIVGNVDGVSFGRVVVVDVEKDGRPDLVVPIFSAVDFTSDLPNVLLLNQGGGQFVKDTSGRLPAIPAQQGYTLSIAAGDVNGDGAPDLYLGCSERRQRLLINDGKGRFSDQSDNLPPTPLRAYHSTMVDLNGDGSLDIVAINDVTVASGMPMATQNQVFLNDGKAHFTLGWMAPNMTAYDSRGLDFGDINHDGILDLVVGNGGATLSHDGYAIQAALGIGSGQFAVLQGMGPWQVGVFGIAVGDLNGDGFADVAAAVAEPDASGSMKNILLLSEPHM